jgi:phosphatidylinositol glycan class B
VAPAGEIILHLDAVARPPLERSIAPWCLAALCLLGFLLRLVPVLFYPSLNFPDEIFQTAEPAHRLVFGSGLVPWEFAYGVRSWLLPGVIAGLMELSRVIGDGPDFYLPVIATAFAALSLAPIICSFLWCRRLFGITGAIIGGLTVAITPDLVYLGARTLSEVAAAHVLVVALYLLTGIDRPGPRRLAGAGALLGLVFALRFHLGPAIALAALWAAAPEPRRRLWPIAAGAAVMLALVAVLDTLTLGYPFASIIRNTVYNLFYGVSDFFGTSPWYFYGAVMVALWGSGLVALLLFAGLGARRAPLLLAVAAAIIAVHMLIGHKEYRFIYPAILLITIVAGLGLAQSAAWIEERLRGRVSAEWARRLGAIAVAGYWVMLCGNLAASPTFRLLWSLDHDDLQAAALVADSPETCGIGLYGPNWTEAGGYTHYHRAVPMYWPRSEAALRDAASGFNALVYTDPPPPEFGYVTRQCFGATCVAERPGNCAAIPMEAMPLPTPLRGVAPPAH